MRRTARRTGILVILAMLVLAPATGQGEKSPADVNLANLQTALNGEFSARARYRAFADKAFEEGYGEVASLFRACARAEEIHAGLFMSLARARGGSGTAMPEPYDVGTTRENLQQAILAEKKEQDQTYRQFAADARKATDKRVADVFEMAREAETEHANLCRDAANHLDELTGGAKSYWVCKGCGYTTPVEPRGACPFCRGPASGMTEIR